MESPVTMRRPCLIQDDGLASIVAGMEPGFSGNNNNKKFNHNHNYNYSHQNQNQNQNQPSSVQSTTMMRRRNSLKNLSSASSPVSSSSSPPPRSGRFYDTRFEEPHFLEACFLCKKPLGDNRDIFMYRGDTPFCSEECRQEQIEIDEEKEKNLNLKALRNKKEYSKPASSSSSSTPSKNQKYPFRTGTVAAA